MKKRILHIINDLRIGGAELVLYRLLSHPRYAPFEATVVTLIDRGPLSQELRRSGIRVHSIGLRSRFLAPQSLIRLRGLLLQIRPDLIQGWLYYGNLAAQLSKVFLGKHLPTVWNVRHSVYCLKEKPPRTAFAIKLGAQLSRHTAKIIYNSRVSASLHEALGYEKSKTHIIPNGFDIERFAPSAERRQALRATLGASDGVRLIGMVARYHPIKDHRTFLEGARLLLDRGFNILFVLAGRDVDHGNAALMKVIRDLDLVNAVRLLGEQPAIQNVVAGLDIGSLTSTSESFPNVLGEAMACGVPCVATDVGAVPEIIGDTGIVVPPKDPEALARGWEALLRRSPKELREISGAARQRICANYSLQHTVAEYVELHETLLATPDG